MLCVGNAEMYHILTPTRIQYIVSNRVVKMDSSPSKDPLIYRSSSERSKPYFVVLFEW